MRQPRIGCRECKGKKTTKQILRRIRLIESQMDKVLQGDYHYYELQAQVRILNWVLADYFLEVAMRKLRQK